MSLNSTSSITPPPTSPTSSSTRRSSYTHSPYAQEILGDADLWLSDVVVHKQLAGIIRFMPYDTMQEAVLPVSSPPTAASLSCSLFLGQVRYEMTAGLIATLLRRLVKVTVHRVDPRPKGCFVVTLGTTEETQRVRALHKRLLFDNIGVWCAEESQSPWLVDYVNNVGRHLAGSSRLPHDCMVVEECRIPHLTRHVPLEGCTGATMGGTNSSANSHGSTTGHSSPSTSPLMAPHDRRRVKCGEWDHGGVSHSRGLRSRPPPYGAERSGPVMVPGAS